MKRTRGGYNLSEIKPFYQVEASKNSPRIVKNLNSPINFNLIVTRVCNADCIHCCANANKDDAYLSLENLKKVLKIAEDNSVFYFVVTGGEPLMYKHIWDLLDLTKDKFGILMNTNGTLITKEVAEKLANYNLASVHISLDGPNQEIYRKQRGDTTDFSTVLNGITNLVDAGVKVTTKMVLTKINVDYIEDVIKLSCKLGVSKLSLAWFKPVGRGFNNEDSLMMPSEKVKEVSKQLYNLKEKYSSKINISFDDSQCFPFLTNEMEEIKYRKLCGDYFFRVDYTGDVFPCPFIETKIGNIFEDPIKKIWNNPLVQSQRDASFGEKLNGVCKTCNNRALCSGGCRSRALAINKDMYSKDPLCWVD
jgi:radical SAM protein with 4Fe4S-binding SPASM domain